jgi:hypothetical protein
MTPPEAQRGSLTGGTQKSVQRKRHGGGRVGLPSTHLCNAGYGSRDQDEFSRIERKEKENADESHLVVNGDEQSILDASFEHPHKYIRTIKRQRREYPRRGINRVITYRHNERNECQNTTRISRKPNAGEEQRKYPLYNPKNFIKPPPNRPQAAQHNNAQQTKGSNARGLLLLAQDG